MIRFLECKGICSLLILIHKVKVYFCGPRASSETYCAAEVSREATLKNERLSALLRSYQVKKWVCVLRQARRENDDFVEF